MPTQYFVQAYQDHYLDAADYKFIRTAIELNEDLEGLISMGEVILKMYNHDAVANCYLGPCIHIIGKKVVNEE